MFFYVSNFGVSGKATRTKSMTLDSDGKGFTGIFAEIPRK